MMNKISIFQYLIFLFVCFQFEFIQGSHLLASDMHYVQLPNNQYEIELVTYRDCRPPSQGGGNPNALVQDNPAYITIYKGNNFFAFDSINLTSSQNVAEQLTDLCLNTQQSVCVNKVVFTFTKTLIPCPEGYTILNQRCCMTPGILNILDAQNLGVSTYCKIPGTGITNQNSSALFPNINKLFFCAGASNKFDLAASDIDGDSLSYELCSTDIGGSANDPKPILFGGSLSNFAQAQFKSPFSVSQPMPGISLNAQSGELFVQSNIQGSFLVTICCHEWRNGVMINTSKRMMVFTSLECNYQVKAQMDCDTIVQNMSVGNICLAQCTSNTVHFLNKSVGAKSQYWDFGVINSIADTSSLAEPVYTYADTGSYTVTLIVTGESCSDTVVSVVNIYADQLQSNFDITGNFCVGDTLQFTDLSTSLPQAVSAWKWDFMNNSLTSYSFEQNPRRPFYQPGIQQISLTAFNPHGCYSISSKTIELSALQVKAFSDTTVPVGSTVMLQAEGASQYSWSSIGSNFLQANGSTQTILCADTGITDYIVLGTDGSGCAGLDTVRVIATRGYNYFVPSAFSPNGDGKNDYVSIFLSGYQLKYFKIFNRRGQEVFVTTDKNIGWNGEFKGAKSALETYYWVACLRDQFNKEKIVKGDFILVR